MATDISIARAIDDGLRILKGNFWPCVLAIVILGILDSFGDGAVIRRTVDENGWTFGPSLTGGFVAFIIGLLVKPVFDFGTKFMFVRSLRGDIFDVKDMAEGFDTKPLYVDIILTNLILKIMVLVGIVCLVLPGIYIACRTVLAPYLVMDKGLGPRQAIAASWELTRDFWPRVVLMALVAFAMMLGGLVLLLVGMIPAFAWIKGMFAAFYQQVLDVHSEEFLQSLDIAP